MKNKILTLIFSALVMACAAFAEDAKPVATDGGIIEIDGKTYVKNAGGELVEVKIVRQPVEKGQLRVPARMGKFGRPHQATWLPKESAQDAKPAAEIKIETVKVSAQPSEVPPTASPMGGMENKNAEAIEIVLMVKTFEGDSVTRETILPVKQGRKAVKNFPAKIEYAENLTGNYDAQGNTVDADKTIVTAPIGTYFEAEILESGIIGGKTAAAISLHYIDRELEAMQSWNVSYTQPAFKTKELKTSVTLKEGEALRMGGLDRVMVVRTADGKEERVTRNFHFELLFKRFKSEN